MNWEEDNYRRYPKKEEEDLLATSGLFRIIYRYLSHKITLREAIEQAVVLYEYRRDKAVGDRFRYFFFSIMLAFIRWIDRLERSGKTFYHTIRLKIIPGISTFFRERTKQTAHAVVAVLFESVHTFFAGLKDTHNELKKRRIKKKKDLEKYKEELTAEDVANQIRRMRRNLTSRRTIYFTFSILIHIIIFYFLKEQSFDLSLKPPKSFEMYAIQLVDVTPQAKDKKSTEGDEKKGELERKKSSNKPGSPKIRKTPQLQERPDTSMPTQEVAQLDPKFQTKDISRMKTRTEKRQAISSKNLPAQPQHRIRSTVPDTTRVREHYRSRASMRRKPISLSKTAHAATQHRDSTEAQSISSLSRSMKGSFTPQSESLSLRHPTQLPKIPEVERKRAENPLPGGLNFEKFITDKKVVMKHERSNLSRTRFNSQPQKIRHGIKIAFRKKSINADFSVLEKGDGKDIGIFIPTRGKKGKMLTGIKKKDSLQTKRSITIRTPLMREGFTVGDVPLESTKREKIATAGPLMRSQMEAQKGLKYAGRRTKGGPISFSEERVTYKSKSRTILKRMRVTTNELGDIEELNDFSMENYPSQVNELGSISKRSVTSRENFSSSISSQHFQGKDLEEEQKVQGKKLLARAETDGRGKERNRSGSKKLAFKRTKDIKTIIRKDFHKTGSIQSEHSPTKKISKTAKLNIKVNNPPGNITRAPLYTLRGEIGSDVKQAFVTINDVTQMVTVKDGVFVAKIAMVKGINKINVLAFSSKGEIGNHAFKILFRPMKVVPRIRLLSPQNGKQGLKEGDMIMVKGIISDKSVKSATLLLNNSPIKVKVINGRFQHKIFLPGNRVNTFRVSAIAGNGAIGYSPLHTILLGTSFDINNPRPY